MSYDPCEKVFSIPGLRLIILSYSLDRIKKKKEIKPFFHRKFPKFLSFYNSCKKCFDIFVFKICLYFLHCRYPQLHLV